MLTGAPFEELVRSNSPDVGEFTYFNNTPDMLLALKSGKTDVVLSNNAIAALAVNRNPELSLFPESLQDGVFGFAFAKGDPNREKWQAAFDAIPEETRQAVWEEWTGSDESAKRLPAQAKTAGSAAALADLEDAVIGVLSGTNIAGVVTEHMPDTQILLYNTTADLVMAVKSGKVDAIAMDEPVARHMQAEDPSLAEVPGLVGEANPARRSARSCQSTFVPCGRTGP